MSLQSALDSLATLNGMGDGDLITAKDWNTLVSNVMIMGTELQGLTAKVGDLETFVGYDEGYSGDNLKVRIKTLEGYVGDSDDTASDSTLSGRVAALEEVDNVTQTEHEALEQRVQPLLDQYIVSFTSDEVDYQIGETATVTATVRTLTGDVPQERPWVDFISTWGILKSAPGFESKTGSGHRSICVRTNSQGIARARVTAEQNRYLSVEEEDEVANFFTTTVESRSISVGKALKNAVNSQDEHMDKVFKMFTKEYESSRKAVQHLVDGHFTAGAAGRWQGRWRPQGTWDKYRTTVAGFVKNDSDPTTPDHSRGVGSIQILFQDWISPWTGLYVEEDEGEILTWKDRIEDLVKIDPDLVIPNLEVRVEESIFELGVIGRQKVFNAIAEASDQIDDAIIPDKGEWVKGVVRSAAEAQQAADPFQFLLGGSQTGGYGAPAMGAIFAQEKHVSDVSRQASQAKTEVLGSTEFADLKGAVTILQSSTSTVGNEVRGTLSDIGSKMGHLLQYDNDSLHASVQQMQSQIQSVMKKIPT